MNTYPKAITFSLPVAQALRNGLPVLAFESAVVTHGLPVPQNLELARSVEAEARALGVTPATIALLDSKVHIGLEPHELERLAEPMGQGQAAPRKISRRDFGIALASGVPGGTTVAGTLIAAHAAGIRVFATGGIGGVHRGAPNDISADLPELARTPMVVVCAGAKAILDLPATLEYLETSGVAVIGFGTDEFPAFYSRESGFPVDARADTAEEVAEIAREQWAMGINSAILVTAPPPAESALPAAQVEGAILRALDEAREQNIRGAAVTPFLLARVSELSHGSSMDANLALLRNNARVGAQIARALAAPGKQQSI